MGLELDVEELEFVQFIGSIERDRCSVYKRPCTYQDAIEEQCVQRRKVQISMRCIRAESRPGNPNRPYILRPRLV